MTTITVASESGRVSVRDLPTFDTPKIDAHLLGMQNDTTGLFPVSSFFNGSGGSLDLSDYTTTTALTQVVNTLNERINNVTASIPTSADLSGYAKKSDIPDTSKLATSANLMAEATARQNGDQALDQKIDQLRSTIPASADLSGYAKKSDIPDTSKLATSANLTAEATARQNGDQALDQKIDQLRSTIPAAPDLSGYAKKSDIPDTSKLATSADLTTEATARQNGDDALAQRVSTVEKNIATLPASDTLPRILSQQGTLIQSFTATGVQDSDRITFPQAFGDDSVLIFITPKTPSATGSWSPPVCGYNLENRYSFGLTRFFTDGTDKTSKGDISVLAIGKPA